MLISARLHALRKAANLRLRQVSELTGLAVSSISQIERGDNMPSLQACAALAAVYGLTLAELFEGVAIAAAVELAGTDEQ